MDDRLTSQTDPARGLCTIKVSGPLLVNIQAFKNQMREIEAPGLIIDLSDAHHVDSVGIARW